MIDRKTVQDALSEPSPSMQEAIAKNRTMQAALRTEYAAYIREQKALFETGTHSVILPTYFEWLTDKMKREGTGP